MSDGIRLPQVNLYEVGGSPITASNGTLPVTVGLIQANIASFTNPITVVTGANPLDVSFLPNVFPFQTLRFAPTADIAPSYPSEVLVTMDSGLIPSGKTDQLLVADAGANADLRVRVFANPTGSAPILKHTFYTRSISGQIDYEKMGITLDSTGAAKWQIEFKNLDKNTAVEAVAHLGVLRQDT